MGQRYIVVYDTGLWSEGRPVIQDTNSGEPIGLFTEEAMALRIATLLNDSEPELEDIIF